MPLLDLQEEMRAKAGKPKIAFTPPAPIPDLEAKVREVAEAKLREAFSIKDKLPRREARRAVKDLVMTAVAEAFPEQPLYKMKAGDILESMRPISSTGRRM